jgi:hypothetical protein
VARRLGRYEVMEALAEVMLFREIPENIRSDNGPEFVAQELRKWLAKLGTGTLYIEPGSPWENGYRAHRSTQPSGRSKQAWTGPGSRRWTAHGGRNDDGGRGQ